MPQDSAPAVLLVEDDVLLAEAYMAHLGAEDYRIVHVETGRQALAAIERLKPEVILLDLLLPDIHGREIVRHVTEHSPSCAVVVATSESSVQVAVEAMRAGAFDFLVKPIDPDRLSYTLRNALERQRLQRVVDTYEQYFARDQFCGFIGSSPPMQAVYRIIDSAAVSDATVFITGESGTGKELCAEAIHQQSPRSDKPIVTLNCAAIPTDLLESEIFGHVKGAFTGAVAGREGAASRADGGTLFFDEICEMDLGLQSKLLRFIQTGSFQMVGSSHTETTDARFVCATNRDPLEEVREGRFREDLYYRLHVIPIELPPLRSRGDDAIRLARAFLTLFAAEEGKGFTGFSAAAEAILRAYPWPGNVRELQNALRRIVVLNDAEIVTPAMLPPSVIDGDRDRSAMEPAGISQGEAAPRVALALEEEIRPLAEVERETIEQAIALCGGNIPQAAARLGISNSTVYRKRQAWDGGPRAGQPDTKLL